MYNEEEQKIQWRVGAEMERHPTLLDVIDGRAEYLLSGQARLAEGAGLMIQNGRPVFWGGKSRPK